MGIGMGKAQEGDKGGGVYGGKQLARHKELSDRITAWM